jgi:hypothetical protein
LLRGLSVRPSLRVVPALVALFGAAVGPVACGGSRLSRPLAEPPAFNPKDQARCGVVKSQAEPLIVEWPGAARAKLEASARRGLVAVRYVGCEMQVLGQCHVPGAYGYTAITTKKDVVRIRDEDELYASIPVYADRFEPVLRRTGELDVEMTIVGRYEADRLSITAGELDGWCEGATHFVTAMTAGAFEFLAGTGAGGQGGAGAAPKRSRETLTEDGDKARCERAGRDDKTPPEGCAALLRVEVVPIGEPRGMKAFCPEGSVPDGKRCVYKQMVVDIVCPAGTHLDHGRCEPEVSTACQPGLYFALGLGCVPYERRAPEPAAPPEPRPARARLDVPPPPTPSAPPARIRVNRLISLPGGTFTMGSDEGSDDEKPPHRVTVRPFAMDETEVTVAAYATCVQAGACSLPETLARCNWGKSDRLNHPVNCVDWNQAHAYCAFVHGSLPTEEEWEYAASGPRGEAHPWGNGSPDERACSGIAGPRSSSCPVAAFPGGDAPSGVKDLLGNVYEWTDSDYCSYAEPKCAHVRVYRGGAWVTDHPSRLRASARNWAIASYQDEAIGFRCVQR